MRARLTHRLAESAKPKAKAYELRDPDLRGFILRVSPTGGKAWVVSWARGQRATIGKWPVMAASVARDTALRYLAEAAQHGAPLAVLEARAPKAEADSEVLTLRQYIKDHYRPWARHGLVHGDQACDRILRVFGKLADGPLPAIDTRAVSRIVTARLKAGVTPRTVNRDVGVLKAALARAVEWQLLEAHPLDGLKPTKERATDRVRYLTDDEAKRLRAALDAREERRRAARESANQWRADRGHEPLPALGADDFTDHLAPLVLVALNTGLRRGELFNLCWEDVNLEAPLLTVRAEGAKSGKARHVPLNNEALATLTRWKRQGRGAGLVFPGADGERLTDVKKGFHALLDDAGVEDFRFHDLRHDFASRLVMAGVDLYTVKELLGHASIEMTQRYAHLAPHKLADAVAKLNPPTA
jgi:integrase